MSVNERCQQQRHQSVRRITSEYVPDPGPLRLNGLRTGVFERITSAGFTLDNLSLIRNRLTNLKFKHTKVEPQKIRIDHPLWLSLESLLFVYEFLTVDGILPIA